MVKGTFFKNGPKMGKVQLLLLTGGRTDIQNIKNIQSFRLSISVLPPEESFQLSLQFYIYGPLLQKGIQIFESWFINRSIE